MKNLDILLIEDDATLANSVATFLKPFANVKISHDGYEGQALGEENIYDLAVLDLMLPGISGYDILKHWREKDQLDLPVLILTAKDTLNDKIKGFSDGADDYLTKPFHREELILRIKALLRRSGVISDTRTLNKNHFAVDLDNRSTTYFNQPLKLNGKEYDLLVYFLQNPNIIITKEQIFNRLWGFESDTSITVVEVYMSNLRRKIKAIHNQQPIKTVRGVGYMMEDDVQK
ncbi:DNA-binding response regulator [Philodulcilactobacillus myokoensis]|uniref:DNA-binding response regulator n=1 Tax=Philodulcilactobacillus myokoensis TaxID=2929573 RepID=A0A9W6EQP9_9LACO|nr:response regulator transcription factor [Philodulcilactobacillus myokoensis]GLB46161.1 DNA-binding response regulator [Philodulcilactobacillus myokoensis]